MLEFNYRKRVKIGVEKRVAIAFVVCLLIIFIGFVVSMGVMNKFTFNQGVYEKRISGNVVQNQTGEIKTNNDLRLSKEKILENCEGFDAENTLIIYLGEAISCN